MYKMDWMRGDNQENRYIFKLKEKAYIFRLKIPLEHRRLTQPSLRYIVIKSQNSKNEQISEGFRVHRLSWFVSPSDFPPFIQGEGNLDCGIQLSKLKLYT